MKQIVAAVLLLVLGHALCEEAIQKHGSCLPIDTMEGDPEMQCVNATGVEDECHEDKDCQDDLKCCPTRCYGNRCEPGVIIDFMEKAGTCPSLEHKEGEHEIQCGNETDVEDECQHDDDCEGDLKCCPGICPGNKCQPPASTELKEKPGTCPSHEHKEGEDEIQCGKHLTEIEDECENDGDCEGHMKCCHSLCYGMTCQNVNATVIDVNEKPGTCPMEHKEVELEIQCGNETDVEDECQHDDDCEGDFKCCPGICPGNWCQPPAGTELKEKPGTCPSLEQKEGEHEIQCGNETDVEDECHHDEDCEGDLKCCPGVCSGNLCQPPTRPN